MAWAIEQTDVEVLSAARRDEVLERILALRPHWTRRGDRDFFTLGLATYQDHAAGSSEAVAESNALLSSHFAPALDDLARYLRERLGGEIRWLPGRPLPGFHIFGAGSIAVGATHARPHFDLQFHHAGYDDVDEGAVVSVTVPIRLPTGGASLEYWPVDLGGLSALRRAGLAQDIDDVVRTYSCRRVWYVPGRACLQTGLPLHRIGPSVAVEPGDYRITLQCHAVNTFGRWHVYW